MLGHTQSHRHVKNLFRKVDQTFHLGTAARQHHATRHQAFKSRLTQVCMHQAQQFLVSRLHHFSQRLPGHASWRTVTYAGHFYGFIRRRQLAQCAGIFQLDLLSMMQGSTQSH